MTILLLFHQNVHTNSLGILNCAKECIKTTTILWLVVVVVAVVAVYIIKIDNGQQIKNSIYVFF